LAVVVANKGVNAIDRVTAVIAEQALSKLVLHAYVQEQSAHEVRASGEMLLRWTCMHAMHVKPLFSPCCRRVLCMKKYCTKLKLSFHSSSPLGGNVSSIIANLSE
jgi:hypothetical protein